MVPMIMFSRRMFTMKCDENGKGSKQDDVSD